MEPAETRYLQRDTGLLAYQVFGEGADVVWFAEVLEHLDLCWSEPHIHALFERLAETCRVACFQARGMGLSDATSAHPSVEQQADDVLAVMDAVGMSSATLFGTFSTAGAVALVAARAPERVRAIVLDNPVAEGPGLGDLTGWERDHQEAMTAVWREVIDQWGSGLSAAMWHPSWGTAYNKRLFALLERCTASPATMERYYAWLQQLDVRDVLRQARVPVSVLHVPGGSIPQGAVEYVAELLPQATFEVLPEPPFGASIGEYWAPIITRMEQAATGTEPRTSSVRLGAVLFTDVVASTELLARIGDHAYGELRATHERQVKVAAERFGGEVRNVSGDGTLSVFDGAARACEAALAVLGEAAALGLDVRAGVHAGEIEQSHMSITGMTVHVAARVMAAAAGGEVLATRAARDLAADDPDLAFAGRDVVTLKGVPGEWELWSVTPTTGVPAVAVSPRPTPLDRAVLQASRRAPSLTRSAVSLGQSVQGRLIRRSRRAGRAPGA